MAQIFVYYLNLEKFIFFFKFYFFIISIFSIVMVIRRKLFSWYLFFINSVFSFYLFCVACLVFSDLTFSPPRYFRWKDVIQLVPFKTICHLLSFDNYVQIVGNILLLLPFPVLLQMKYLKKYSFMQALLYTLICSLLIEMMQLFINFLTNYPNKFFDVDDLLLNTIGGLLGWLIFKPLLPYFYRLFSIYSFNKK